MKEAGLAGSSWPGERQKLLLKVALADADSAGRAWAATRSTLDIDTLDVASQALLPLVGRRLEQLGLDVPEVERLRGMRRRTWYVNQLAVDRLLPVLRAAEAAGAEPLLAGSWELPAYYHGDLGLRRVLGLHALVRPDHLTQAIESIRAGGWPAPVTSTAHATRLRRADAEECVLYHRRFREFVRIRADESEDVWENAVEISVSDNTVRAVSATDEFARLCLDDAPGPTAIWVADAVAVLRAAGDRVDWERLVGDARSLGATLPLRDVCVYLRREFGAEIPEGVTELLARTRTTRRERIARRMPGAPATLTRWLRATAAEPPARAVLGLPGFLQQEWGLSKQAHVPGVLLRKLRGRAAS